MALHIDQMAIDDGNHFIDSIGKQQAPVKNRDFGGGLWNIIAVQIYDAQMPFQSLDGRFPV